MPEPKPKPKTITFEGRCTKVAGGKAGLQLVFAVTSGLLAGPEIAALMAAAEGEGQRIKAQLVIVQENLPFENTQEPAPGGKDPTKGPPKRGRGRPKKSTTATT